LFQSCAQTAADVRRRARDLRIAVKRFGYGWDQLGCVACLFYVANRWGLPASWKSAFLRNYYDDLLFIPAALPWVLWLQRWLGLRQTDAPPDWREVLYHLVIWSFATEVVGPHLFRRATGDVRDVAAYAAGAIVTTLVSRVGSEGSVRTLPGSDRDVALPPGRSISP
jgi:hypothetical protein